MPNILPPLKVMCGSFYERGICSRFEICSNHPQTHLSGLAFWFHRLILSINVCYCVLNISGLTSLAKNIKTFSNFLKKGIQLQKQINHRGGLPWLYVVVQITHDHLGRFYLDINTVFGLVSKTYAGWWDKSELLNYSCTHSNKADLYKAQPICFENGRDFKEKCENYLERHA